MNEKQEVSSREQHVDVMDQDGRRSVHCCERLESVLDKVFLSVPGQRVPGQLGAQGAASSLQVTGVSDRTAVLRVGAADRPGIGAAGPLRGRHLTARLLHGAVGLPRAVTWYVCGDLGVSGLGPYHFALREGEDERVVSLLLARSGLHVAGVSLRTAVLVVGTANRLDQRAAAPLSCLQFAAGRS